jgi:predicted RecB family nuclease
MLITEEIFQAYLKCETKAYLKSLDVVGNRHEFSDWERRLVEDFKRQFFAHLRSIYREDEYIIGVPLTRALDNERCRLLLDCVVQIPGLQIPELQSHIHILERPPSRGKTKYDPFVPIRLIPQEKLTPQDKLLLAFDALALSAAIGDAPPFGQIIHGSKYSVVKVKLDELMKSAKAIVDKIAIRQASPTPPRLILNKHCAECEYQPRCRQLALEKDDLSLLSSITEKEIKKQHSKGIFSVTQLSYTFRARRKPRRSAYKPDEYSHALRALAIRERKIHIAGKPELTLQGNPVYLDVEGVPDRDFYYLIGLRFRSGNSDIQVSFWANDLSEEKEIWTSFLQTLAKIETPQLVYYGSYETAFLKRMRGRYGDTAESPVSLDQLIVNSVNILPVIYAHIYFPTYSNGLKEIAKYLGFQWSETTASGLNALMWRLEWEFSNNSSLKQKLVTYNAEDCEALEKVTGAVAQLCQRQTEATKISDAVHTDSMKRDDPFRFGNKEFSIPELQFINQSAYWDYQREKIYVRSSQRLKRVSRKKVIRRAKILPINKIIEYPAPSYCPKCKSTKIFKHNRKRKIVHDIKFGRTSIKRWIVKYLFYRYSCSQCEAEFHPLPPNIQKNKYGWGFVAYVTFHIIELAVPQESVTSSLNKLFKFQLSSGQVNPVKSRAAQFYKPTYEALLKKISCGSLIHADETMANIQGKSAYVWVFTNLEEVAYLYTETREGDFLQELLKGFKGVLVSDFYAAYDSINSPQQKCLIHLMRD